MSFKNLTGTALIGYGPNLPSSTATPDGSLFYKTVSDVGGSRGLYVFGFIPDSDPVTPGGQVAQGWTLAVNTAGLDADTLDGLDSSAFQPADSDLSALAGTSTTGFYVRTGTGSAATRSLTPGAGVTITNQNGVSGNPTISIDQASLSLGSIGGTLPVNKGGTGLTAAVAGGILYGVNSTTAAFSSAGTNGQVLISTGGGLSWQNQSSLSVGSALSADTATSATTANSAATLSTPRNIGLSGVTATAQSFNGSSNITIPITAVPASLLTGTIASGLLSGTYPSASIGGSAGSAAQLSTARTITLAGDVTGSANFDGSANITITTTVDGNNHTHTQYALKTGDTFTGNVSVGSGITLNSGSGLGEFTRMTLSEGASGAVAANTNADALVIEGAGNTGITMRTPNTGYGAIFFADDGSATAGQIRYTHSTDAFTFFAGGVSRFALTSTSADFSVALNTTGALGANSLAVTNAATAGSLSAGTVSATTSISTGTISLTASSGLVSGTRAVFSEGTSGAAAANSALDTLVLESSGAGGLTIRTPNSTYGGLAFGDDGSSLSGQIRYTHTTDAFTFYTAGTVGFTIASNGDVTAVGNVTAYSDRRLKKDIDTITDPLGKVSRLRGVNFTRVENGQRGTGLIAQDVLKVAPEAVAADDDGLLSVAYGNLVGLLVEAIKDQQRQIEDLKDRVQRLSKA